LQIVNGPEILNKYVGESESNIRKLFEAAEEEQKRVRNYAPGVVVAARMFEFALFCATKPWGGGEAIVTSARQFTSRCNISFWVIFLLKRFGHLSCEGMKTRCNSIG